jgi:hypothetical protein
VLKLVAAPRRFQAVVPRTVMAARNFACCSKSRWPGAPHIERIRAEIAGYRMAVRSDDRPKDPEAGTRLRHLRSPDKTLSVTVSIGAAEPDDPRATPAEVLRASDKALYRAKEAGRNRVSR